MAQKSKNMKSILEKAAVTLVSFLSYGREKGHVSELLTWWVVSVTLGLAIGTVKAILS